MDPDSAYTSMLDNIRIVLDNDDADLHLDAAVAACEDMRALDAWLRSGGYLPAAWQPRPHDQGG